jgi:hypothetical protein
LNSSNQRSYSYKGVDRHPGGDVIKIEQ